MSYWGYVIEQLVHEDERMQVARVRARKRRRARRDAARSQQPPEGGSSVPSLARRRLTWSSLVLRH